LTGRYLSPKFKTAFPGIFVIPQLAEGDGGPGGIAFRQKLLGFCVGS